MFLGFSYKAGKIYFAKAFGKGQISRAVSSSGDGFSDARRSGFGRNAERFAADCRRAKLRRRLQLTYP
jgi:hypothetical protein